MQINEETMSDQPEIVRLVMMHMSKGYHEEEKDIVAAIKITNSNLPKLKDLVLDTRRRGSPSKGYGGKCEKRVKPSQSELA